MADPVDVGLTVGGWIVATLVTLLGLRYAHRKEVESQRAHEDSLAIYHPLRKEMETILADAYRLNHGYALWSPSPEFEDIRRRGLLLPARHDVLRQEIDVLLDIDKKHQDAYVAYYQARVEALQEVLGSAGVDEVGGGQKPFLSWVQLSPQDDQLLTALAGDEDRWLERLKQAQKETSVGGARVDWRTLRPTAEQMYFDAEALVREPYTAYRDSFNSLMAQAKKIRDRLDASIRDAG